MSANLRNIESLRNFRVSLIQFIDHASAALQTMGMEMRQSLEWIENDRPQYWGSQTRRAFDLVDRTRTSYETCRLRTVAGHRSACLEEKEAYEAAKRRVQFCQEQIQGIKSWANRLEQESNEFRGRLSRLQSMLETDLPNAVALLDKLATTLESYAEINSPMPPDGQL